MKILSFLGAIAIVIAINTWAVFRYTDQRTKDIQNLVTSSRNDGMLQYKGIVYLECIRQGVKLNFTPIDSIYVKKTYVYR